MNKRRIKWIIASACLCIIAVLLKLYKSDGQTIDIAIAADGCAVWHSDGVFYKYGGSDASQKLFNLFGIDLPLATFVDR